jgi:transposase-like protein
MESLNLANIAAHFSDEDKARDFLEKKRWPDGPICPHCGVEGEAYKLEPREGAKTHARKGVYKCAGCREQFSVTVGTIFEDSHIPLNKWLLAFHLMCASKKGMSAHQLHRILGVTYKSAWFMAHRIRYAMSQEPLSSKLTGIVEVDECFIGGKVKTGKQTFKPVSALWIVTGNGIKHLLYLLSSAAVACNPLHSSGSRLRT